MSKQFKVYLLIFLILFSSAVVLHFTNRNSTFRIGSTGFAVKDIKEISEISMAESNKQITLTRISDGWLVNNQYRADNQLMLKFLRALGNLGVKSPVPYAEQKEIMELLKETGVEVKIKKRWKTKSFRVLQLENKPTYMVLGNSKSPFLVEVPGLIGVVGQFFVTNESSWREKVIFAYNFNQIAGIKVDYPSYPEKGFEINSAGDDRFELYTLPDRLLVKNSSDSAVFRYITYFSYVPYTRLLTSEFPQKKDSLRNAQPFASISVTDKKGMASSIHLHLIKVDRNEDGFDPNVLHGLMNNGQELALLTFVNVDLLLKEVGFFKRQEENRGNE